MYLHSHPPRIYIQFSNPQSSIPNPSNLLPIKPTALLRLKRRPNLPPLNLAKHHTRRLLNLLNNLRVSLRRIARTSIPAIKPVHETALIPPHAHRQHHPPTHRTPHPLHRPQPHEIRRPVRAAKRIIHGDRRRHVLDDLAVLHVLADDGLEVALGRRELRDDGEGLGGVDLAAGLVVRGVGVVGVLPAAVLVADAGFGALVAEAAVDAVFGAGVGGELRGDFVGFPDVELVAADAFLLDVALVGLVHIYL